MGTTKPAAMTTHDVRRYSIEIKDFETEQTILFTAADWSRQEIRVAVARILGEAGVAHIMPIK